MKNIAFARVDLAVLKDKKIHVIGKNIFAILCALSRETKSASWRTCKISIRRIAEYLGGDNKIQTVRRHIKKLVKRGILIPEHTKFIINGKARNGSNLYYIVGHKSGCYPKAIQDAPFWFARVANNLILDASIPASQKVLLMHLRSMLKKGSEITVTYIRTLAERMGRSMSSIYNYLHDLRAYGILCTEQRFIGKTRGKQASAYYVVGSDENIDRGVVSKTGGGTPENDTRNIKNLFLEINTTDKSATKVANQGFALASNISADSQILDIEPRYFDETLVSDELAADTPLSDFQKIALAHLGEPEFAGFQNPCNTSEPFNTGYTEQRNTFEGKINSEGTTTDGFSAIDNIQESDRLELNEVLSLIPSRMLKCAAHLIQVTKRNAMYRKEIEALKELDKIHTPSRIIRAIDKAVKTFIKLGKNLKTLFFGYVKAMLSKQKNTFNKELTQTEAKQALDTMTELNKKYRQEAKEYAAARAKVQAEVQAERAKAAEEAQRQISPATPILSVTDAQATIHELEGASDIQNTEHITQYLESTNKLKQVKPTCELSFAEQNRRDAEQKQEALEYILEKFGPDSKDTLVKSIKFGTCSVQKILAVKEADRLCSSCPGVEACPYHRTPPTLYIDEDMRGNILFYAGYADKPCTPPARTASTVDLTKARDYIERLGKSGLTPEQCVMTFKNFNTDGLTADVMTAKAEAMKAAKDNRWLLLSGKPGTGKTHLAIATALCAMQKGRTAIFRTATELLNELWEGYDNHSFDDRLRRLKLTPCLVIDELGRENNTKGTTKVLFEILNYRYTHGLQTIITTNYTPGELVTRNKTLYAPLFSRLAERGSWCAIQNAGDFRASHSGE